MATYYIVIPKFGGSYFGPIRRVRKR